MINRMRAPSINPADAGIFMPGKNGAEHEVCR
jgi:hypothetical protein